LLLFCFCWFTNFGVIFRPSVHLSVRSAQKRKEEKRQQPNDQPAKNKKRKGRQWDKGPSGERISTTTDNVQPLHQPGKANSTTAFHKEDTDEISIRRQNKENSSIYIYM